MVFLTHRKTLPPKTLDTDHNSRISKRGDAMVRTLFYEAANAMLTRTLTLLIPSCAGHGIEHEKKLESRRAYLTGGKD